MAFMGSFSKRRLSLCATLCNKFFHPAVEKRNHASRPRTIKAIRKTQSFIGATINSDLLANAYIRILALAKDGRSFHAR
jgi:hypothetical protein